MIFHTPNDLFHNRYRLKQRVGVGGMSEVWTAIDEKGAVDEVIALKIFSNQSDKKSLRAEYTLMRKFNHPNLLRPDYFDIDEATEAPFMIMKYYSKGSVSNIINNSENEIKSIDENLIAQFILSASKALCAIQNQESKIIHQDIKPDNFLINDDGSFVLADFGVSTISKATRQIKKTQDENDLAGVPAYVAPERFKGAPPRFSQDIFSLGVTIYEILTGVLPFQEFGGQRLNQGFPIPDLDPAFGYSSRLNTICKRCMELEPDARPNATELLNWAQLFIKNGFWPEISSVDISKIKSESIFKNASIVYHRLINQQTNTIDIYELNKCIEDLNSVINFTNKFPDATIYKNNLESIALAITKSKIDSQENEKITQDKIDNLISDADGLVIRAKNNEIGSLKENILAIEKAIIKYQKALSLDFNITNKAKLDSAYALKEQVENKNTETKINDKLKDSILDGDIIRTKVEVFIDSNVFTIQTLEHNLLLINQAIDIYSSSLSFSPSILGKKRKVANELKQTILNEIQVIHEYKAKKRKMNLLSLAVKIISISIAIYLLILSFHKWQSNSTQSNNDEINDITLMQTSKPIFFISGENKIKHGINEIKYKCNINNPGWKYSWLVDSGLSNFKIVGDELKIFNPPVGNFEIKLTVTNENGISETDSLQIRVLETFEW